MQAAGSLARGEGYPGSIRAPGFSAAAAGCLKLTGKPLSICLFFAVTGGLAALFVYLAGKTYADQKTGLLASAFYALNLTAVVNAPMLLSDTFFGIMTALQLWFFVLFWKKGRFYGLVLSVTAAALGTLIRPINLLWFLPVLFLLVLHPGTTWKKKLSGAVLLLLIFWGIISPWMVRNASRGAGFCIDVNTGAMLHQNGAMLLAEVNRTGFEEEKAKMISQLDQLFTDKTRFPDEKSKVDFRKKAYTRLILQHPFIWLKQQFQWKILLPDVPTGFELLGLTSSGRGTMGVLAKEGLWKALDHYFNGKPFMPLLFLPLLLPVLLTYAGCLLKLFLDLKGIKKHFFELLVFLAFAEYYLFLPGAITAPRYQIPALPVICVLAAAAWTALLRRPGSENGTSQERSPALSDREEAASRLDH